MIKGIQEKISRNQMDGQGDSPWQFLDLCASRFTSPLPSPSKRSIIWAHKTPFFGGVHPSGTRHSQVVSKSAPKESRAEYLMISIQNLLNRIRWDKEFGDVGLTLFLTLHNTHPPSIHRLCNTDGVYSFYTVFQIKRKAM